MSAARLEDGWIRIPYDGVDLARVEVSVGEAPLVWVPAFKHTIGNERLVQIRPHHFVLTQTSRVWIRVNGAVVEVGRLGSVIPGVGRNRRG